MLAAFATNAKAQTTADTDGSCQLMTATCNENGFEVTFDTTCQSADYKAVKWNELYANGPSLDNTLHTFGTDPANNVECRFANDNGEIKMNFNFRQCGTTHDPDHDAGDPNSNPDDLVYYNKIQGHEYYGNIIMGVSVDFSLTCTGSRIAEITVNADNVNGDATFVSSDAVDRPADWAQHVLNLDFYTDSAHSIPMDPTNIAFGQEIYAQITTNVVDEAIITRATDCWATGVADPTSTPKFDLIEDSCVANDPTTGLPLEWVRLDSAANGASPKANFDFQAFRFDGSNSFWLHCKGRLYLYFILLRILIFILSLHVL